LAADLESTAELPVLDPAVDFDEQGEPPEPADAHHTDTWIVPRAAPAAMPDPAADEARARFETSLRKAYAQLRDAEGLLAVRDERVRQLEDSLQEAREAAEQQLAQLRAVHEEFAAAAAQHRAELDNGQQTASAAAKQRANELSNELAQAHGLLNAVTAHAKQLQQALDAREAEGRAHQSAALERRQALVASERAHASTLRDLNAERERNALSQESLHRAESHRQIFDSVVSDLQRELDEHESSLTRLRAELAGRDTRAHEQDAELARRAARIATLEQQASRAAAPAAPLVTHSPAAPTAEPPPAAELAPLEAGHADGAAAVEATPAPEAVHVPQAGDDASAARTRELEADLRAAEDTINRLESQARGRGARLEELEKANRQWRLTMEEARATSTDHETHDRQETHGAPGHEPLPEGATRLLICKEKGREIVHVLGRKTSVGRTPDNDLQIDAKFVSRHHAAILAGPVNTVIEDLNSTNGVLVNGQRVTRQMLKDGDEVVFGRAHYRFAVRRAGEKR
jgi:FHA domain-containing protein